eukprot:19901-Heterococcus_DN1.PRE.4
MTVTVLQLYICAVQYVSTIAHLEHSRLYKVEQQQPLQVCITSSSMRQSTFKSGKVQGVLELLRLAVSVTSFVNQMCMQLSAVMRKQLQGRVQPTATRTARACRCGTLGAACLTRTHYCQFRGIMVPVDTGVASPAASSCSARACKARRGKLRASQSAHS